MKSSLIYAQEFNLFSHLDDIENESAKKTEIFNSRLEGNSEIEESNNSIICLSNGKRGSKFQKCNLLIRADMQSKSGKISRNAFLFWSILMHNLQKKVKDEWRKKGILKKLQELNFEDFCKTDEFNQIKIIHIPYQTYQEYLKSYFPSTSRANFEIPRIVRNLKRITITLFSLNRIGTFNEEAYSLINNYKFDEVEKVLKIEVNSVFFYYLITDRSYTNIDLDCLSSFKTLPAMFIYEALEREDGRKAYSNEIQQPYLKGKPPYDGEMYDGGIEIKLKDLKNILRIPEKRIKVTINSKGREDELELKNPLYGVSSIGLFLDRIKFKENVFPELQGVYPKLSYDISRANNSIIFKGFSIKEKIEDILAKKQEKKAQRKLEKLEA